MKSILPLCLLYFLSTSAFTQIVFTDHYLIDNASIPNGPYNVHAADIDGDGDMDVLSACWDDGEIAWYENLDGLGNFGPQYVISTNQHTARAVFAADLDGDGDMDALSASIGDGKIAWYENLDGLGNFGPQQIISQQGSGALSVFASDLDGDGDMDVLAGTNNIVWYENIDGLGDFSDPQIIDADVNSARSIAADLDGDGDMDVLSSTDGTHIVWHENTDGLGNFGPLQIISSTVWAVSIHTADLDSDGDMDVLFASNSDSYAAWHENVDGNGEFGEEQVISTGLLAATAVYTMDADNDGDIDILTTSGISNKIFWHENTDGLGAFGNQQIITEKAYEVKSIYAADINGDGNMDVLSASFNDDKIAWYENIDGLGTFGAQRYVSDSLTVSNPSDSHTSDLDGDGDLDILITSSGDGKITWYENEDGLGTFGVQQIISSEAAFAWSVHAVDVDNDGDMDVISSSGKPYSNNCKVAWFENIDGLGSFSSEQIIYAGIIPPYLIDAMDVNNDGNMDVIAVFGGSDQIVWYENEDGLGTFGAQQTISNSTDFSFVHLTDLNSDGHLDFLTGSYPETDIIWFENIGGTGTFNEQQIITTNMYEALYVNTADLDGDGDMDVISGSGLWNNNNKIYWYENLDGLGTFDTAQIITTTAHRQISIQTADVDADGDIDVISTSHPDDVVVWYENTDGLGTFGMEQIITDNVAGPKCSYVSDIDGDGDIDVVAAAFFEDNVVWLENLGLDTASPIAACNNVSLVLDSDGLAYLDPLDVDNGSIDDLFIETYAISQNTFTCDDQGALNVTLTVTDLAGNTDSCIAVVNVIDAMPPVAITQDIIIDLAGATSISITPEQIDNGSYDNCGIANLNLDQNTFTSIGSYLVNLTVKDSSDNSATEGANVTVINTIVNVAGDDTFNNNLRVFPIPTSGRLLVEASNDIIQIEIYNSQGQLVLHNIEQTKINLSQLSQGLYFCKVKDSQGNMGVRKVVKQ